MSSPNRRRTALIAATAGLVLTGAATVVIRGLLPHKTIKVMTGAVLAKSQDPHLQRPVGNATVIASTEAATARAVSAPNGLFRLELYPPAEPGEEVKLTVEHADFQPFVSSLRAWDQIYVLQLTPAIRAADVKPGRPEIRIANIRVRYATRVASTNTIGTAVRTFEIDNTRNVPCQGKQPCSPDGRWKATVRSVSLDTGDNAKQFRNVRLSCIAGPCPFSVIENDQFSRGGRTITAAVRNWSDTVTWLIEAEVAFTSESDLIRHTYPASFGRSMNFTLPALAKGLSIEAEVDGSEIVFPLGPELQLSWATCRFDSGPEGTKQYRCELKAGYRFD
jgi:hypothetical protein